MALMNTSQISSSIVRPEDWGVSPEAEASHQSKRLSDVSSIPPPNDINPMYSSNEESYSNTGQENRHVQMSDIPLPVGAQHKLQDNPHVGAPPNIAPSLRPSFFDDLDAEIRYPTPDMRPPSPAASVCSDVFELEPLPANITIVEEAEHKIDYHTWRKKVLAAERVAGHIRVKEAYSLFKLRRIQAVLADNAVFEGNSDLGHARVELTYARRRVKSTVNGAFTFRNENPADLAVL